MRYAFRLARTVFLLAATGISCGATDNVIGSLLGGDLTGVGGSSAGSADLGAMIAGSESTTGGAGGSNQPQGEMLGNAGAPDVDGVSASGAGGAAGADAAGGSESECIIRVATSGSDSNDGNHFGSALRTVQGGLAAARALIQQGRCSAVEVWVAAGTYQPTTGTDRTASFQLVADVALFGGFAGTESRRTDRNIALNVTTLSGEIATSDESDNSYHVVTGVTGATLDGFTISEGFANADSPNVIGAGMYNESSSPTVTNCIFTSNFASAGAGMYNLSSSPTVTSCTFANNTVEFGYGAGMYNDTSSPAVTDCIFTNNAAQYSGAGMYNINSTPTLSNSSFTGNFASETGGAIANDHSAPIVTNSTFRDNNAYLGGGMYNLSSSPTVTNCIFADNSVAWSGQFTSEDTASGGAIYNDASSPTLTNCTFTGNVASYSGGALLNVNASTPTLTNTILWGDTASSSVSEIVNSDAPSASALSHCIVQGGYLSDASTLSADPLFADSASDDLQLKAGSPAIDAGDGCANHVTVSDEAGNNRWDIGSVSNATNGVDIGALEYQGKAGVDTLVTVLSCP